MPGRGVKRKVSGAGMSSVRHLVRAPLGGRGARGSGCRRDLCCLCSWLQSVEMHLSWNVCEMKTNVLDRDLQRRMLSVERVNRRSDRIAVHRRVLSDTPSTHDTLFASKCRKNSSFTGKQPQMLIVRSPLSRCSDGDEHPADKKFILLIYYCF